VRRSGGGGDLLLGQSEFEAALAQVRSDRVRLAQLADTCVAYQDR
jgi:hypothetical protein